MGKRRSNIEKNWLICLSIIRAWKTLPNTKLKWLSIIRAWKTTLEKFKSNSKNITCWHPSVTQCAGVSKYQYPSVTPVCRCQQISASICHSPCSGVAKYKDSNSYNGRASVLVQSALQASSAPCCLQRLHVSHKCLGLITACMHALVIACAKEYYIILASLFRDSDLSLRCEYK